MSRTVKGSKAPGYDYGQARPGNEGYSASPNRNGGKHTKRFTHRTERQQGKHEARNGQGSGSEV